jgi:hypothetical protein
MVIESDTMAIEAVTNVMSMSMGTTIGMVDQMLHVVVAEMPITTCIAHLQPPRTHRSSLHRLLHHGVRRHYLRFA